MSGPVSRLRLPNGCMQACGGQPDALHTVTFIYIQALTLMCGNGSTSNMKGIAANRH